MRSRSLRGSRNCLALSTSTLLYGSAARMRKGHTYGALGWDFPLSDEARGGLGRHKRGCQPSPMGSKSWLAAQMLRTLD